MILSDRDIKTALEVGEISIDPFEEASVQPASVDLRLDNDFLIFNESNHTCIDVKQPIDDLMKKVIIPNDGYFVIHPGQFVLGKIFEKTGVSNQFVGRLEGKSSLGRIGLIIHATAGFLDPGNNLKMTLELSNIGTLPIKLYYKMPIAQMAFEKISSPCEVPYGDPKINSKYYGAEEVQASQFYKNFNKKED